MKVDAYQSTVKPKYGLVVPAGTDLDLLGGDVVNAIKQLAPWSPKKLNVDISTIAVGDLLEHINKEISEHGAGLTKIEVNFTETFN